jgi:formate dehydrogenase iron-sulfur subunit
MSRDAQCYDTQSCIRCFSCMVGCAAEYRVRLQRDNHRPVEVTAAQALPHLSFLTPRVTELGSYPEARRVTAFRHCKHCETALCLDNCPASAIMRRPGGAVVIQEEKCIGCQTCVGICPFEAPTYSKQMDKAYKCIQCYDRTENGLKQACVNACPTGALFSGSHQEVAAEARKRAAQYTKSTGIPFLVYGADRVNAVVGSLGWMTIAPAGDAEHLFLPANPKKG